MQPGTSKPVGWSRGPSRLAVPAAVPVLIVALFFALWNQAGYIGGGGDEYHYLIAARCTAEHGFCVAPDHWWRRWPIVAPTGFFMWLMGESQTSIAIAPLLYALTALLLLVGLVERLFGRREALIAGIVLAATPVFTLEMTELNIDVPELVFCLAALIGLSRLLDNADRRWAIFTGLMVGLAIQARPTSLALLPIFAAAMLMMRRRDWLLPFLAAALVPSLVEMLVYALATGDPMKPWKLSLGHTKIPSTELLPGVDMRQSPLFNPAFIGGWKRPMHINVHWAIDGLLNLIVHPEIALTLLGAAMLALVARDTLHQPSRANKALWFLAGLAVLWFGALTYGLAIDPKPRMFLPVAVAASIAIAVLAMRRWPISPALPTVLIALILLKGWGAAYDRLGLWDQARATPAWIAEAGPNVAIEARTARFLALVPEARALPVARPDRPAHAVLLIGDDSCRVAARDTGFGQWRIERQWIAHRRENATMQRIRHLGLFFAAPASVAMCVLSRT